MAYMNAMVTPLPAYTPQNWDAEVGARIKTLMIGRGTQAQLASLLDLNQTDISKRINGRVPWRAQEIGIVAQALGVSVAVIYGEGNEKGPKSGVFGPSLPDLDSNQEPAGITPAPVRLVPRRSLKPAPIRPGIVTPMHHALTSSRRDAS